MTHSAVPVATTATNTSDPKRSVISRPAAIIAALCLILLAPSPAQSYAGSGSGGRVGHVSLTGYTGSAISSYSGYRFHVPVMFVYRNGAVPNYQEEIEARFALQRWNGNAWANVGGETQRTWSGHAADDVEVLGDTTLYSQIKSPGYFRVVTTIVWGGAAVPNGWSGYVSGWRQWLPNNNSDFSCTQNASRCVNYGSAYGGVYVNG